ncbi:MAG TPA: FAD-dependent oxidoreductase [Hyphomicrobiaceae bacterium]|nr:FAD-dependent oxidoreductase [Hyphomicrobiaceae bacterium]
MTIPSTPFSTCIVAGGGPAGMMTGYLLARAGIDVVVLEKHADFLRDFRGDTIHPSTMEALGELGLLDAFLQLPHQEVRYAEVEIGGERVRAADFTRLPLRCNFIAFVPQWDFLSFIAERAKALPGFTLMMETEAVDLICDGGRIAGVRAETPTGVLDLRTDLVIAADGRHSVLREAAGLSVRDLGAPMDVLWFKVAHGPEHKGAVMGRLEAGHALIMLDRGDYWQCALVIRKGTAHAIKTDGLQAFRARVARLAGEGVAQDIASLDDVKLLTVRVDRLETWHRPGFLCIGDAAHAMSPIGGVGINLAIQDAIATANLLVRPLRDGALSEDDLLRVQQRRAFPTWATQAFQVAAQNRFIEPLLKSSKAPAVPWVLQLINRFPFLQGIPARLIGLGFRPEHVNLGVIDGRAGILHWKSGHD